MGQLLQRNAAMFSQPQAAPISLGQYGMPSFDMSQFNTAGGLGIPDLGQSPVSQTSQNIIGSQPNLAPPPPPVPAQNFLAPHELNAIGFGGVRGGPRMWNPSQFGGMRGPNGQPF